VLLAAFLGWDYMVLIANYHHISIHVSDHFKILWRNSCASLPAVFAVHVVAVAVIVTVVVVVVMIVIVGLVNSLISSWKHLELTSSAPNGINGDMNDLTSRCGSGQDYRPHPLIQSARMVSVACNWLWLF